MRISAAQALELGIPAARVRARISELREMSRLEAIFALQIRALGLPEPEREYQFDETRRWKFDFAWPAQMVAVEIDGRGHQRDSRYYGDVEKGNRAALAGWLVLHVTRRELDDLSGIAMAQEALER